MSLLHPNVPATLLVVRSKDYHFCCIMMGLRILYAKSRCPPVWMYSQLQYAVGFSIFLNLKAWPCTWECIGTRGQRLFGAENPMLYGVVTPLMTTVVPLKWWKRLVFSFWYGTFRLLVNGLIFSASVSFCHHSNLAVQLLKFNLNDWMHLFAP